jgi:hypothetical protein
MLDVPVDQTGGLLDNETKRESLEKKIVFVKKCDGCRYL